MVSANWVPHGKSGCRALDIRWAVPIPGQIDSEYQATCNCNVRLGMVPRRHRVDLTERWRGPAWPCTGPLTLGQAAAEYLQVGAAAWCRPTRDRRRRSLIVCPSPSCRARDQAWGPGCRRKRLLRSSWPQAGDILIDGRAVDNPCDTVSDADLCGHNVL